MNPQPENSQPENTVCGAAKKSSAQNYRGTIRVAMLISTAVAIVIIAIVLFIARQFLHSGQTDYLLEFKESSNSSLHGPGSAICHDFAAHAPRKIDNYSLYYPRYNPDPQDDPVVIKCGIQKIIPPPHTAKQINNRLWFYMSSAQDHSEQKKAGLIQ